jgi:hypothetical protein
MVALVAFQLLLRDEAPFSVDLTAPRLSGKFDVFGTGKSRPLLSLPKHLLNGARSLHLCTVLSLQL